MQKGIANSGATETRGRDSEAFVRITVAEKRVEVPEQYLNGEGHEHQPIALRFAYTLFLGIVRWATAFPGKKMYEQRDDEEYGMSEGGRGGGHSLTDPLMDLSGFCMSTTLFSSKHRLDSSSVNSRMRP